MGPGSYTWKTNHVPFYSQLPCEEEDCTNHLPSSLGHSLCRRHAPCHVMKDTFLIWDPEGCDFCFDTFNLLLARPGPTTEPNKTVLKKWVRGFQRNRKGPYLMKELHREILFPKSSPSVVWGVASALPSEGELALDEWMETDSDVSDDTERSLL